MKKEHIQWVVLALLATPCIALLVDLARPAPVLTAQAGAVESLSFRLIIGNQLR